MVLAARSHVPWGVRFHPGGRHRCACGGGAGQPRGPAQGAGLQDPAGGGPDCHGIHDAIDPRLVRVHPDRGLLPETAAAAESSCVGVWGGAVPRRFRDRHGHDLRELLCHTDRRRPVRTWPGAGRHRAVRSRAPPPVRRTAAVFCGHRAVAGELREPDRTTGHPHQPDRADCRGREDVAEDAPGLHRVHGKGTVPSYSLCLVVLCASF